MYVAGRRTSTLWPARARRLRRTKSTFSRERVGDFFQTPPQLSNTYTGDRLLQSVLKRWIPSKSMGVIETDLSRFGHRVATDIYELGLQCEREPPYMRHHDAWGRRTDQLCTSQAWRTMHAISAEEGLVAIAYERQHEEFSRLYQAAKLYLYSPSSGLYSCPLAMTDGAAKVFETYDLTSTEPFGHAFTRLTSRDPAHFWTSGQWMTERRGGSDVADGTETTATPNGDSTYGLRGYKWFTSASDADMTLTLARITAEDREVMRGTKGLSLFYAETRDKDGCLNNIHVQRLKNKLGTRQLPTAELLLDNLPAHLVNEEGRGVAGIAGMLTITRYHNAIGAVAAMRRILMLSRDYSQRREAFGKKICDFPLHMQTLARMEVETRGALLLVLEVARLIGMEDCNKITEEGKHLLRILTPLTKLYTGKQAMSVISEGLESFGGQGYIEDTGIPALLRDAQVYSIWEGTTNILSLDVLRGVTKSGGATLVALADDVERRLPRAHYQLAQSCDLVQTAMNEIQLFVMESGSRVMETAARDLAYSLTRVYAGTLLLEHASSESATEADVVAAVRWCSESLVFTRPETRVEGYGSQAADMNTMLVMDGWS